MVAPALINDLGLGRDVLFDREYLRGSSLARHLVFGGTERGDQRASGPKSGADHAVDDHLPLFVGRDVDRRLQLRRLLRHGIGHRVAKRRDQPRCRDDLAPLGDFRGEMRLLQGGHGDRSLTDSHTDGLAREPDLIGGSLEGLALPLRRRHETGLLAGDVDARQRAVAEGFHESGHALDAHALGEPEKIHVAR